MPPESDIAAEALRRYFGPYPGVVRAEIKAPHVFSLEEPIDTHIPSSLDEVISTEKLLAEAVGSISKAVRKQSAMLQSVRQQFAELLLDIPPVSQITQPFEKLSREIRELVNFDFKRRFEGVFKTLREIDLEKVNERMLSAGRALGARGWLVGPFMSAQGLSRVLEKTDERMKERYPVENLIGIVEEPDDFRWQKTILEAIHSYRDGRYRVVILSLFPVIEALIRERADSVDADGSRITEVNKRVYEQTDARAQEEFHLFAAHEASIVGFIKARWLSSPNMSNVDPSELSNIDRNWAVHGVDDPERWNPIDAHRLLQVAAVLAHEKRSLGTADEN